MNAFFSHETEGALVFTEEDELIILAVLVRGRVEVDVEHDRVLHSLDFVHVHERRAQVVHVAWLVAASHEIFGVQVKLRGVGLGAACVQSVKRHFLFILNWTLASASLPKWASSSSSFSSAWK